MLPSCEAPACRSPSSLSLLRCLAHVCQCRPTPKGNQSPIRLHLCSLLLILPGSPPATVVRCLGGSAPMSLNRSSTIESLGGCSRPRLRQRNGSPPRVSVVPSPSHYRGMWLASPPTTHVGSRCHRIASFAGCCTIMGCSSTSFPRMGSSLGRAQEFGPMYSKFHIAIFFG